LAGRPQFAPVHPFLASRGCGVRQIADSLTGRPENCSKTGIGRLDGAPPFCLKGTASPAFVGVVDAARASVQDSLGSKELDAT
jgi:hypothetical protein